MDSVGLVEDRELVADNEELVALVAVLGVCVAGVVVSVLYSWSSLSKLSWVLCSAALARQVRIPSRSGS